MAQNIGELAVKLGFDVDDSKLKEFDRSINDVFTGIVKFAGLDLGVQGIKNMAIGAADTALSMRDLNREFGLSYEWMQKFKGQFYGFNPLDDINAGLKIETALARYSGGMPYGTTGSEYLRFAGANPTDTPEKMLEVMHAGLPEMIARYGETQTTKLVEAITGDPGMMVYLKAKDEELEAYGKIAALTTKQNEESVKAAEAIGQLHGMWDNFINHVLATFVAGPVNSIHDRGLVEGWKYQNRQDKRRARAMAALGTNATEAQIDAWVSANTNADQDVPAGGTSSSAGVGAPVNLSSAWAAAFAAQEKAESSGNPLARNVDKSGGVHYGLLQWSETRRAKILAGTGIDVASASAAQQRQAELWEAQQMGMPLGQNLSAYDASEYLSHKFVMHEAQTASHGDEADYRARMAQNMGQQDINNYTTINVSSTDPEQSVVHIQRMIQKTWPWIQNGAPL